MISRQEYHGDCIFVTASYTGMSHRMRKIPNQDVVDFMVVGDNFAMAVSDGVGSCIKAELGANAAVSAVMGIFKELSTTAKINPSNVLNDIIDAWHRLLGTENPDDCCATMKAAMKIGNRLMLFSIGDGMLAVASRGIKQHAPLDNEFFLNQTTCLNSRCTAADFWISEFRLDMGVPYAVFACSDGVSNGIKEGLEMELVSAIDEDTTKERLQNELETLLIDLAEYSSDDLTVGVVKYE